MDAVLKAVHRHLAERRRDGVLEATDEQLEAAARIRLGGEQALEGEGLAEDRGRLGQRQRRLGVEEALLARQHAVDPVAQLVGEGEHRTPLPGEAQQHVRVGAGDRRGAEGPGLLVGPHGGIDPAPLEEVRHDGTGDGRERRVGVEHDGPRLVPGRGGGRRQDRRHAVVVGETVEPEQLGLQAVVPLGDVVAGNDGIDQRLNRRVRGLVGEVAGGDPARVAPAAVLGRLVEEQGVEDVGTGPQLGLERLGEGLGGAAAHLPVGLLELRERLLQADRLGVRVDADLEGRGELGEQPAPRR